MKPRAIDLFCGAGGATKGLQRAGFHVTGIDIKPQPRYCGNAFIRADALKPPVRLNDFDFVWASPPCQAYSLANNIHGRTDHPKLIEPTRKMLAESGRLYCIENVPAAPLISPITLCGLSFGLNVKRHRHFELGRFFVLAPPCGDHRGDWVLVFGHTVLERSKTIGRTAKDGPRFRRRHLGTDVGREAMDIPWMNRAELSQAIPPAYAEFIGRAALRYIGAEAAA
jgi:DNA (cytosine-5)-methyltransferase 1